jgi:hypothetical protein
MADNVVYTAIFGDYDYLHEPRSSPSDVDFVCFTDGEPSSDAWEVRTPELNDLSPSSKNRAVKILPHRFLANYETSLYVDGNMQILGDVSHLFDDYSGSLAAPPHPRRSCVYAEAEACKDLGKAEPDAVDHQMERYRQDGMPERFGLWENGLLLRSHHDDDLRRFSEHWWKEFRSNPHRDQLSFPYVVWSLETDVSEISENVQDSDLFRLHPHLPEIGGILPDRLWIWARANRGRNPLARVIDALR